VADRLLRQLSLDPNGVAAGGLFDLREGQGDVSFRWLRQADCWSGKMAVVAISRKAYQF
jgi:hypothetical protein